VAPHRGRRHVLLGTSNLVSWQLFIATGMLAMGW
jgi:hypothetical protein